MSGTCTAVGCDVAAVAKGLCRRHYGRERDRLRHRHRDDALLRTRARNRAVARLIDAHPDEFAELFAEEKVNAEREAEQLAAAAPQEPVSVQTLPRASATVSVSAPRPVRLLSGPRPDDQAPVDRIRADVGRCARCQAYHDRGHRCADCGSAPKAGTA